MKIDDKYIVEIGGLTLKCKDVVENKWKELTFIFDVAEGHIANSGFLYNGDKVRPASARIKENPLLLNEKINELRDKVYEESGHYFKQLLIQMENETNRIKIDFEFDDPQRWTIKPAKSQEMREKLRPKFD